MLNYILFSILLVSVICGFFTGNAALISSSFSSGAVDAIKLCLDMGAVVAFWSGIMKIAGKAGIIDVLSELISPIMHRVFPKSFKIPECRRAITMNITSNMLGLGNAATIMGINALKLMKKSIGESSGETVRFLVLNCASVQLLPTTVAAIRSSFGSSSPFDILVPVWVVTLITLIFSFILCDLCSFKHKSEKPVKKS